jgi:hypothetical protein
MPVKKIFQVEVDDTQFKRFQTLFNSYQAALAKLPQNWNAVNTAVTQTAAAHTQAAAAVTQASAQSARAQANRLNKAKQETSNFHKAWSSIATSAREVDKAIERSTIKMAKWGGLAAGVLGGLVVVGSLDLPLNFHPAAIRASADFTPWGAG